MIRKTKLLALFALLFAGGLQAQDTTNYKKIITKAAVTRQGMFTVHQVDGKYYFEIPDSMFNRDILVVNRFVATPEESQVYGGEKVSEQTVYFEKGAKVFLRLDASKAVVRDTTQAIYKAVRNAGVRPIAAAFDVKTTNPDNGNVVIEVTDFFRKDNLLTSLPADLKTERKIGSYADDRSFIGSIHTYPINIEVRTTKTYSSTANAAGAVTFELNTSMVMLPAKPMRKRFFDERVGYFANKTVLYDDNAQSTQNYFVIQRYNLQPSNVEAYKRGELVEPVKQIVYYIDPATPKKWRPYLIAGVNDWNKAFEQAGFKNAIVAKEWPEGDTTMSMEDARFSVIRYFASETANAYGPRISDPRSGEIIESHVGWYHNVMKLVHDWYMVQVAAVDPRARKMVFDDELMGDLIRFVSSHEVGHSLGLRHNMGASSQTPVVLLRDKKWVEANGHTASIMDYARFNYVAQPEDSIGIEGLYPRINVYDKWAIQWGYKQIFGTEDEYADNKVLNKWIVDSLKANPRLWFGGEGKDEDPRSQTEDLGDDAVKAGDYGIMNLKRIMPSIPAWTAEEGDLYNNLKRIHKAVLKQYNLYVYHVMKYVSGTYVTQKSTDEAGDVYVDVPKARVKSAIDFLGRQVMQPPLWLYPAAITGKMKLTPMDDIANMQNNLLNTLLNPGMLYTMMQRDYALDEYLNDIKKTVWRKSTGNALEDVYLRNTQRMYIERIAMILKPKSMEEGKMLTNAERSDGRLYVRMHLEHLKQEIMAMPAVNSLQISHKQDLLLQIKKVLEAPYK
ncbi:zinc-dependent metalloprotease [Chitinophaga sancti]|uniref:Zinc-dependent metalloprotease n=1 Tax=Chitinophaga sancti TaxID=1004 RepID=A0A1K1MKF3_9BACT|nr:zinc-dependent metalloprotease [Chitinophaga sancti]WQD62765.1 zinc-dependent metalloprotease [Chitinophaga sancti]WQG91611.1 zinc-dependent metalloprotease [Chitinophaga sancti]SFW23632.1 protein of unknown function [Chitinophaga sancti]